MTSVLAAPMTMPVTGPPRTCSSSPTAMARAAIASGRANPGIPDARVDSFAVAGRGWACRAEAALGLEGEWGVSASASFCISLTVARLRPHL